MTLLRRFWTVLCGDLSPDFPITFCPVCSRLMRAIGSDAGSEVRICPKFHRAVIALSAADVRGCLPLIEVCDDIRAMQAE